MTTVISGSSPSITFSDATTQSTTAPSTSTFGFKNRIINGGMVIDQRNAGASVPTSSGTSVFFTDRFAGLYSQTSKFSAQQLTASPPVGFSTYLGATSASAYTVGVSEQFNIYQAIEGYNITDLQWGTANAKTVTLSFWVQSSLTGTFGGCLNNTGKSRAYPFTYSIPVANTWTQISVTIAGDTSGTWDKTNGVGIYVNFGLGVGSSASAVAGSWTGAGSIFGATGATSVVGTNGATFYITGVQLEVGTQATSFDFRDYGRELILCQRYFCSSFQDGIAPYNYVSGSQITQGWYTGIVIVGTADIRTSAIFFPASMRTTPLVTFYKTTNSSTNGLWAYFNGSGWVTASTTVTDGIGNKGFNADMSISGGSTGQAFIVSGMWAASAEL